MNFFEQQERARRNSGRLVLLLALAVISLISLSTFSLVLIWAGTGAGERFSRADYVVLTMIVATLVIGVVLLGFLYKSGQLKGGGRVVAERLGGRLINLQPRDFQERRLLNVVEEMALASGIPVPPVYVLDEPSINAFAAGLTLRDAVIGITRGAIETLTREELQGVIAHEFSHIFHGDMRLNTRLVAVLHGILVIGLVGHTLLRAAGLPGKSRIEVKRVSGRGDRNGDMAVVVVTGLVLLIIGYTGTFFGNMIKAAVSRQREFLADASAVQFTRNPGGIAGALKKIGGHSAGSQLQAGNAAEFSHMYFGQGVSLAMEGLFATHPPLRQRILRIEPRWDGDFPAVLPIAPSDADTSERDWTLSPQALGMAAADVYSGGAAEVSIAAIGSPEAGHLAQARDTLQRLPERLRHAAHSPVDAQVLMYGLLLDADAQRREHQLQKLRAQLDIAQTATLEQHLAQLLALPAELRLPLLELAVPALKSLPSAEQLLFRRSLALLILADQQVSLMEWTLLRIIERNLVPPRLQDPRHRLSERVRDAELLLSAMAHAGHTDPQQARLAFLEGANLLPGGAGASMTAMPDLKTLDGAVARLSRIWPLEKPKLLKAMARCVGHDGQITAAEAELMRAVADSLDCPMPPLLPAASGVRA